MPDSEKYDIVKAAYNRLHRISERKESEPVTIYDIAKEAGVAASTVSRVINNKPGLRPETRERVRRLLEKYNFTPDAAARGLVMQATRMVGILIVDIRVAHHTDSAYVIEQALTRRGYCCITMSTGPTEEGKANYIRILEERRVEGVILMGSMFATEKVKESIKHHLANIPVVIVNGYLDLPNVSGVIVDENSGVERCVDLLVSKGKRKVAFVLDQESPSNLLKQKGYIDGMKQNGVPEENLLLYDAPESSVKGGYDITVQILKEHPDIEGIIYSIDLVAVGGVRAASDLGLRIPDQIGLIGVDNAVYGEICSPKLTTLDNKTEEMSEFAAEILWEGLKGKRQNRKMMLFSEIIERETT